MSRQVKIKVVRPTVIDREVHAAGEVVAVTEHQAKYLLAINKAVVQYETAAAAPATERRTKSAGAQDA